MAEPICVDVLSILFGDRVIRYEFNSLSYNGMTSTIQFTPKGSLALRDEKTSTEETPTPPNNNLFFVTIIPGLIDEGKKRRNKAPLIYKLLVPFFVKHG